MFKNKSLSLLFLGAIASGLTAVYFTDAYLNNQVAKVESKYIKNHETVKIVVANSAIKGGDVLSYDNLSLRDIPLRYVHESAVRSEQADAVIGKRILHAINKGESLLYSFLSRSDTGHFADLIKEGERAVTFPVDLVSSMSGLLRPGNRVDLMLTLRAEKKLTRPLLKNVTVLATGDSVNNDGVSNKGAYQTITISVTPKNASRITLARSVGTISVVLRSSKDNTEIVNEIESPTPISVNTLFGDKVKHRKKVKKVEIIVGG